MKKCPKCSKEYKDTTTLCPADGAVLEQNADALVGETLAGKYRIDEFLSEGGMGTVYRGTHILMDKTVAIKVLLSALASDDTIVARFSREARAASRISHPHALNVTDFGETEDGTVFLVMEFLDGQTLKELVKSEGPLPLPRVVEIMRQVSGALEAAHTENVVHRDLKSDNIMLVEAGVDKDWAKVLDFGIAKIQEPDGHDPELTAPNLIIGTPQYMSPEQCSQSSGIDARSDIYSLGIILYEMLAGHVPFTGESPTAIMMKQIQEPPPDILEERSDLPPAVGRVVARALDKDPAGRFQSAGDLAESLAAAADSEARETVATGADTSASDRSTNRIIVPTGANESPRTTVKDDDDESTVVQPRSAEMVSADYEAPVPPPALPIPSGNSWRVALLALIGVLIISGVLYALTRGRQANAEPDTPPLTADPNSQPVQPAKPPTGQSELGIPQNASNSSTTTDANTNTSPNAGQSTELPPPLDNVNANTNANSNQAEPDATPPPANKNSNQTVEPTPAPSTPKVDVGAPPPLPSPSVKQQQKPALPKPLKQSGTGAPDAPPSSGQQQP